MTNLLGKQISRLNSCKGCEALFGVARASMWKIASVATVLFPVFSMATMVVAQTQQTRQTSIVQEMSASVPLPQLEFVGKEDYEVNGTKATRYKLTVANRRRYPDFLWQPSPNLPPCGKNENAARTWVEVFGSPGGKRLGGFCGLRASADLDRLWFPEPSGESAPACVYIVMTDRQTGKKYNSHRVCSRSFAVATRSLKGSVQAAGGRGHEGNKGWIEVGSVQFNEDKPEKGLPEKLATPQGDQKIVRVVISLVTKSATQDQLARKIRQQLLGRGVSFTEQQVQTAARDALDLVGKAKDPVKGSISVTYKGFGVCVSWGGSKCDWD